MCAQGDHPPYDDPEPFDPPAPRAPSRYVLSGSEPPPEPASIALAVLGEMLEEAERDLNDGHLENGLQLIGMRISALREARNRVMAAGG